MSKHVGVENLERINKNTPNPSAFVGLFTKFLDTVFCIATSNGLDGQQFEPRWGQKIFSTPHPSLQTTCPIQPLLQCVVGLCPWGYSSPVAYPGNFSGGSNNFSWGQRARKRDLGGGSPLVRGSTQFANE
jgi:hypothetical protein